MFRKLQRILGLSPKLEWRCGNSWNVDLIVAIAKGSEANIAEYRSGHVAWERDCDAELHEFKLRCLKYLLDSPLPDNQTDASPLTSLPASFTGAFEAKQEWLNGKADDLALQRAFVALVEDTQGWWPSNWCFGINAMFCAKSVAQSALQPDSPASSTGQCAENLIMHMAFSAGCQSMNCGDAVEPESADSMTGEYEDGVAIRGVDCPHMEDSSMEEIANKCMSKTALHWRKKLTEELVDLITPQER